MRKLSFIILILFSLHCTKEEAKLTKEDWTVMLTAIYFNVDDICIREYGTVSPLIQNYATNLFAYYPATCENVIIGNSTMDIGRQVSGFYDPAKTNNYGIGGNTACDMLVQMNYILCTPKNVIIASADGNGVLRGVSAEISAATIQKIINKAKEKWDARTILVGVHPVQVTSANQNKNKVNALVRDKADCFIDMVKLFGVGETDAPPSSLMLDAIHYKEPVYTNLKDQIQSQCGVGL